MSKATGYKQIALPIELIDEIKKFVDENKQLGYTGVPEFIRDAIRDKLKEVQNNK